MQNLKTKKRDIEGIVKIARISEDGTISSYEIKIGDHLTTRHRRYMSKIKNTGVETDESGIPEKRTEAEPWSGPTHSSRNGYRLGSLAQEMLNRGTVILIIYSVICTIALGIMIYFLTLKCSVDFRFKGDNNIIRNQNKYNILSVNMSKDGARKCSRWF